MSAVEFASQFENSEHALERAEAAQEKEDHEQERAREAWSLKQQLEQDRSQHTFHVEWYNGRELPFNPLPDEASDALDGKRSRMAHCAQHEEWEELLEQVEDLAEKAPEWLEAAWDGDEPMLASEWTDIYDDDELMKLLNKVDQKGDGAQMEAVAQFLG